MDAGKSLTVAKYLLKDYVINPFLKRFKRVVLTFLVGAAVVGIAVAAFAALIPGQHGANANQTAEEPGLGGSVRGALLRAGVTKEVAISAVSASFSVIALLALILGGTAILVREEAEYELLLAQPMKLSTYFLGRELAELGQASLMSLPYFGFLPLAYELSGGSAAKALLLPATLFTAISLLSALGTLANVVRILAGGRERLVRLGAAAYLSAGAIHSLLAWGISPLLSLPFRPLAESVVYCATISEGVGDVLESWGLSALGLLAVEVLTLRLADFVPPDSVRPASELTRVRAGPGGWRPASLYSPDPGASLFRFAFTLRVLTPGHLRYLAIALAASGAAGLAAARVGSLLGLDVAAASLATVVTVGWVAQFLVASTMAGDMAAMWALRVYALDLRPLASGLLLRYEVYLSEAFLAMDVFLSAISGNPATLLHPIAVLPLTVFTALLLLASTTYLASKRRITRQAPRGFYMFEEVAMGVLMAVFLPPFLLAALLFNELLLPRLTPATAAVLVLASIFASWLLHEASKRVLAGAMRVFDLVS